MGGMDTTGAPVGRPLPDARQAPTGMTTRAPGAGNSGGRGVQGSYVGDRG